MTAGAQLKIAPLSPVSCGSMVCRMDGARTVVVAVKATFSLHHERLAELVRPDKVVVADRFGDNPEAGSHFAARELVPSLPRPGAIVYGHARAPAGAWVVSQAVRFCVYRPDRTLCDKRIVVVGDRSPQGTPRPWNVLPLVHERAFGGPGFPQNPLGTGASEGSRAPNLVDPSDPRRPACFAPIPPGWPARLQHLRGWDIRALDQPIVEIPRGFSAEYFHPAPADQRFDALRGDEWILLEGMVQDHPRFTSRLPSAQVQGRLHRRTPRGWVFEEPFTMGADMLVVDADRQTASLVFRGWIPQDRDDALQGACLYVGLSQADDPITWPDADDLATPTDESSDQTRTISLSAIRAGLEKRVAPFEISPPSASAAASAPIPGAPWAPHAPAPTVTPVHDATSTLPPQGLRVFAAVEEEPTLGETAPMPAMGRSKPATLPFAGTPEPKPPVSRAEPSTSALPFVPGPPQPFATAPEPPAMVASLEPPALVVSPELPAMVVSLEPPALVASLEPPAMVSTPEPPAMVSTPEPPPLVTALPALSRPPWALNARPLAYAPPPAEPPPEPPAKVLSAAPEQAPSEPAPAGAEPGEQAPSEPAAAGAESPALPLSEPPRQALSEPAPAGAEPPALPLSEPPAKALSEPPAAGAAPPKTPADGGAQTLRDILLDRLKNERSIADLPFEFSDLAGLDLASVNLAGVRLRGAILRGTNLTGARLTGADLTGADLSGATLRDAVADTADLTRANLEGADFTGASLIDANLTSCHGARVDFTSALLSGADLRQARLSGARLDGADLRKATCAKADLSGASLVRADLTDAVLRSCRLKGADLTMAKLGATDLRDADLEQANLTGVDRSRAKLAGASLKGVVEEPSE